MTNKLPEIGKRYIRISPNLNLITIKHIDNKDAIFIKESFHDSYSPDYFWENFKELPDQEPNKLPVIGKRYIYKVLPEVYGTIIVYKLDGLNIYTKRDDGFTYTYSPALFWNKFEELPDQEQTTKQNRKSRFSREVQESKSIWKPISELPDLDQSCFIRSKKYKTVTEAYFYTGANVFMKIDNDKEIEITGHEYCTIADFINHQENLEERITKLENKHE